MICTHPQAYAPHYASFELSAPPAPIRYADSAQARSGHMTVSGPALPQGTMASLPRGLFATHAGLQNPMPLSRVDGSTPRGGSLMHDGVGQLAVDIRAVPNSPTPLSRLSGLNEGVRLPDREVIAVIVDSFVGDVRSVQHSPTPLSRLSALDDRFGHQDREVMLRKIDQFFDGLSA